MIEGIHCCDLGGGWVTAGSARTASKLIAACAHFAELLGSERGRVSRTIDDPEGPTIDEKAMAPLEVLARERTGDARPAMPCFRVGLFQR